MKICSVVPELLHLERHKEANKHILQTFPPKITKFRNTKASKEYIKNRKVIQKTY
jgi:hypothetical protein